MQPNILRFDKRKILRSWRFQKDSRGIKHEIVAIAPTLDAPTILLKSPTPKNFPLIKSQYVGLHLSYDPKNRVENNTRVLVGHEQYDLCDIYILDVVHDTTENYFERGKFGCRNL